MYSSSVRKVNENIPTSDEWLPLKCAIEALKPYEEITKKLSDTSASVAEIIPLLHSLKSLLSPTDNPISLQSEEEEESTFGTEDLTRNISKMMETLRKEL